MKKIDCAEMYSNGIHYDLINSDITDDILFYSKQAWIYGSPVLEIACGTGRITIPMANNGFEITGIDISQPMLDHAKQKSSCLENEPVFLKEDCRDFNLNKQFNLIYFPFNSITHLHDLSDIEDCFTCIKKHLTKEGRFILSVFNPSLKVLIRPQDKLYPVMEYKNPDGPGKITIKESNKYDNATQINHILWHFFSNSKKPDQIVPLNMRMFFPEELDALLKYNGFEIKNKYGSFEKSSFNSDSMIQIFICSKKKNKPVE